jgi:uncharacterized protein YceH (UPF0502 family)
MLNEIEAAPAAATPSSAPAAPAAPVGVPAGGWPTLAFPERRVLGVLVEKQKTTPDVYPLSLNALATGCNQKSNREPTVNLSDEEITAALTSCQQKGLVVKVTGGRVDRWRHQLYETWNVSKVELAILAELMLRGPQTEGELRAHTNRMEPIADVEALRAALKPLTERKAIIFLGAEGRRGTTITHGFHEAADLENLRSAAPVVAHPSESRSRGPDPALVDIQAQLVTLQAEVSRLQAAVAELQRHVHKG